MSILTNNRVPVSVPRAAAMNSPLLSGLVCLLALGALALGTMPKPTTAAQIFVTNFDDGTVETYTTEGASLQRPLVSNVLRPTGIAVVDSNVFVAKYYDNSGIGSIAKYTTDGQLVNSSLVTLLFHPTSL